MMVQPAQSHNREKNDSGKGWNFKFNDDNKMSYKYIPSITYCKENKESNREN